MTGADAPWTWRLDPAGGGGAFADLGSHAVAAARFLVGPIAEVLAASRTAVRERPLAGSATERRTVEVDDMTRASLRFENGATGSLEANWMATGRKMSHDFEVYGSKGALAFSGERLNQIELYLTSGTLAIIDKAIAAGFGDKHVPQMTEYVEKAFGK